MAIAVLKSLRPGQAANVAALLMGQLSRDVPAIYGDGPVVDVTGRNHAAIHYCTVVLQGTAGQLERLVGAAQDETLAYSCFSALGQGLNNKYDEYVARLRREASQLVGVAVFGPDGQVRRVTKPFSVLA